ncbi:MAG: hypothetical protein WCQ21_07240 [Verrucomicrobiota bacterium]|jgi:hypothetical protein
MKTDWSGSGSPIRGLHWSLMALLLLSQSACTRAADPEAKLPLGELSEVRIVATVTPGKPGAPSESISAAKDAEGFSLRVARIEDSGSPLRQEHIDLPKPAFDKLWQEIERQDIRNLAITAEKQRSFDFGERRLCVEWKRAGAKVAQKRDLVWIQPLQKDQRRRVEAIFSSLNALRAEYARKVPLYYFPDR